MVSKETVDEWQDVADDSDVNAFDSLAQKLLPLTNDTISSRANKVSCLHS